MIIIILLLLIPEVLTQSGINIHFQQHDYNDTLERIEVVRYNENYMKLQILTFKYNRTTTAFNITMNFICDVKKVEAIIQQYKFMSNEYRLFPLRMQYNFCKGVNENAAGFGKSSCGNFTDCNQVAKGRTYRVCRWTLDQTKLPPFIPSGKYMTEIQFLYYSTEIGLINVYGSVTRPEVTNW